MLLGSTVYPMEGIVSQGALENSSTDSSSSLASPLQSPGAPLSVPVDDDTFPLES